MNIFNIYRKYAGNIVDQCVTTDYLDVLTFGNKVRSKEGEVVLEVWRNGEQICSSDDDVELIILGGKE